MKTKAELKWFQFWKLEWWEMGGLLFIAIIGGWFLQKALHNSEKTKLRHKLKYFSLTTEDSFWGHKDIWTERQKPLTDEEVDELMQML